MPQHSYFDANALTWKTAVIANGGTVSDARLVLVSNLIEGLKFDGVWAPLDRLWLFAGENSASALTDLVGDTLTTATNSPTFTVDRGYTGDGSSTFISGNSNPTTIGANYVRDSACQFAWDVTGGGSSGAGALCGGLTGGAAVNGIGPDNSGTYTYGLNSVNVATGSGVADGVAGLYLVNRSVSTTVTLDKNGAQVSTLADNSFGMQNTNLKALTDGVVTFTSHQVACHGFGGSLTTTLRTALYNRLRTYMTAVGVP
jgi:hypothetical protein